MSTNAKRDADIILQDIVQYMNLYIYFLDIILCSAINLLKSYPAFAGEHSIMHPCYSWISSSFQSIFHPFESLLHNAIVPIRIPFRPNLSFLVFFIMRPFVLSISSTSSFLLFSIHDIFPVCLRAHTSNVSSCLIVSFLCVHISAQHYSVEE